MLRLYSSMFQKCIMCFIVIGFGLIFSTQVHAEGFSVQDWSARGSGLAGGMIARGGDASTIAYNPAAIMELEGTQIMIGGELVMPRVTINFPNESFNGESTLFAIPSLYITHNYYEYLSFGLGVFSRFGLGNSYDSNWPGRYNIVNVELQAITVNPNVAFQLNDSLSFAVGLEFTGATVNMNKDVPPISARPPVLPTPIPGGNLDINGDAFAFSYNAALFYRFNEEWTAGLTYRSKMDLNFSGDVKSPSNAFYGTDGNATINLPDQISLGVAWQPIPALSLEADISYYVWSSYKELKLEFNGPAGTVADPKHWNDTYLFALSAEYDIIEWLTLRAGVSYETSPLDEKHTDYLAPTNGRFKYAVGLGYNHKNWTVDAAYVFSALNDIDYKKSTNPTLNGGIDATNIYANSITLSLGYKF